MMRVVMMTEMSRQVNEEVSRDMTGEADAMNQGGYSKDAYLNERSVIFVTLQHVKEAMTITSLKPFTN